MTSAVRKLYIDSRHCEGTPSDFTFQLPQGISTDNTLGIVLSRLSMPNATSPWTYGTSWAWRPT